jgi:membrane associated rhomboid family serine protease
MVPASVGFQCPECVQEGRRTTRVARNVFGGRAGGNGEVTKILVAINVVIYVLTALNAGSFTSPNPTAAVYNDFALVPAQVAHGEWYRVVSSMFLHYGIVHIAFNMWALWVMGIALEGMLGRLRFLGLYFLSGLGGSVLSFATGPVLTPAAGASGAIFGLFGAFFVVLRRRNLETGGIVGLIAVNLVISFTISNIDWRGHVGGLIVGTVVGFVFAYAPSGPQRDRIQLAGCAAVAVALLAGAALGAAHVRTECPQVVEINGTAVACQASG